MLSAAVVPGMKQRGRGAIVNVGSTAGQLSMGAYSSIKAWVTTYTESLANELHGSGVTATVLMPGWVRTEFHQRAAISSSSIPNSLWLDAERPGAGLAARCRQGKGDLHTECSVRIALLVAPASAPQHSARRLAQD